MKSAIIALLLVPVFSVAQTKSQKRAEKKADKQTLINLKLHVAYLAGDELEGRRAGTKGEILASEYISRQFEKAGLAPMGTNGYIQEFTIFEGKEMDSDRTALIIDDKRLVAGKDFYPMSYCKEGRWEAEGSPALREQGSVWFTDLNEIVSKNKNNPHFEINNEVKNIVKTVSDKGARGLIFYNSSKQGDELRYNKFDTATITNVPVFYVNSSAYQSNFSDLTAFYSLNMETKFRYKERKARNVIGFINNNAENTVVIGAHYDHIGYGEDGNSMEGSNQIHNGADDNASGTAAMIELARILKNAPAKNNNYLFIAFSAEEIGLLGSNYWLENPTLKTNINYMINLDMIGRYNPNKTLTVGGFGTSPVWADVIKPQSSKSLLITLDSTGSGPSDHASFYRKGVPVLFFFTNFHEDYHKPGDDAEKLNYDGKLEIIKLINNIINKTDGAGKLPFLKTAERTRRTSSFQVSLGVVPDYAYIGAGLKIQGISTGKIAEQTGLKEGDIIMQLGAYTFNGIDEYMETLKHFKKGDKTVLVIVRNGETLKFDIVF